MGLCLHASSLVNRYGADGKWWVVVMAVPLLCRSCGVDCCHQHIQVLRAILTANVRRKDAEKQPFVTMPHVFRCNVWKSASKILQDQSMFTLLGNSHFPFYPSISCVTSRDFFFFFYTFFLSHWHKHSVHACAFFGLSRSHACSLGAIFNQPTVEWDMSFAWATPGVLLVSHAPGNE